MRDNKESNIASNYKGQEVVEGCDHPYSGGKQSLKETECLQAGAIFFI